MEASEMTLMESRPGVFVVGSSGVGKRTILSRLLSVDFEDSSESSSQTEVHGWTINTKYYTADVSVWISHICDDYSLPNLPQSHPLVALVMVFDLNELSTLVALQHWFSRTDITNFDILLCIGNKVDLVPHHPAHVEYRRRLLKATDSTGDLYSDIDEFGISESEGSRLLASEDTSLDIKGTCLEWCSESNIEFIEACASNPDFDKCKLYDFLPTILFLLHIDGMTRGAAELVKSSTYMDEIMSRDYVFVSSINEIQGLVLVGLSVDGDSQGVERLFGALSAHMWPGMILKSGDKINEPVLPHGEESSEEESEYELEYEVLSAGSVDPWENIDERWVSANETHSHADAGGSTSQQNLQIEVVEDKLRPSGSRIEPQIETDGAVAVVNDEKPLDIENDKCYEFEDVEQLMSEIGNIRDNLRLMPDFQRREIAANLAMKMASMFGGDSDEEEEPE